MTSILDKNTGKAFILVTRIYFLVTTLYEIFNQLQAFFFPFVGYQSGNQDKTHFALSGSRSEHRFAARSRVLPKHKIGPQCVHVWLTKLSCFLVSGVSVGFYQKS